MTDKLVQELIKLNIDSIPAHNSISPTINNISVYIHLPENATSMLGRSIISGNDRGIIRAARGGISLENKGIKFKNDGFDVLLRKDSDSTKHPNTEEIYRIPYKHIGPYDVTIINDRGTAKVKVPTGHDTFVLLWPCATSNDFTCTTIDNIGDLADWILIKSGNEAKFNIIPDKTREDLDMRKHMKYIKERWERRESEQAARKGGKRKTLRRKRRYKKKKTLKSGKSKKRTQKRGKKRRHRTHRR